MESANSHHPLVQIVTAIESSHYYSLHFNWRRITTDTPLPSNLDTPLPGDSILNFALRFLGSHLSVRFALLWLWSDTCLHPLMMVLEKGDISSISDLFGRPLESKGVPKDMPNWNEHASCIASAHSSLPIPSGQEKGNRT